MKIIRQVRIAASADRVWQVFAHDFNNAGEWMASIPKSYGQELGQQFDGAHSAGRVCELDGNKNGVKAVEEFLAYDEQAKSCTVDITLSNAPALIPITGNVLDFMVRDSGPNESIVDWVITPKLKSAAIPFYPLVYPLLKVGLGVFVNQIIEELQFFVETGKPHSRKLRAIEKLAAKNGPTANESAQ